MDPKTKEIVRRCIDTQTILKNTLSFHRDKKDSLTLESRERYLLSKLREALRVLEGS